MKSALQKLFKQTRAKAGFTLIELLVVIGILGILASALVATIDPFEQLKKASDSNTLNTSVEFYNSVLRYYTTHNAFPWNATPNGAGCNSVADPTGATILSLPTCVTALIDEGELKSGFDNSTTLKDAYVTSDTTTNSLIVCYKPTSKSQQKNPATKYKDGLGTAAAANYCKSATGGTNDCYWCTK